MNVTFLPDLSALAILIVILAMVRRRHSDARADAWLLGLSFTLIESIAHTFYAAQGVPNPALHVIVLDCYVLAGLVFNWAAGDQQVGRTTRLTYLGLNGLPLLALTSIYGLNLRISGAYVPAVALPAWPVLSFCAAVGATQFSVRWDGPRSACSSPIRTSAQRSTGAWAASMRLLR